MIRNCFLLCLLLFSSQYLQAQQYGLFNTKTLFDGFENPAQKTFVLDSSRQFASNFFLPYFALNANSTGEGSLIRNLAGTGLISAKDVPIGSNKINTLFQNTNIYLFNFKIFKSYKYHKEIGLSWQLRTDGLLNYTNETLAIIDNYQRFNDFKETNFQGAFNNNGRVQSYHQFSLSYRENYNKRLAFGVKLSLLSGIFYNRLNITNSAFQYEEEIPAVQPERLHVALQGYYKASFLKSDELKGKDFIPAFKNPGVAVSFGTTYTAKSGVFIMANIKDIGIIKWAKTSHVQVFNQATTIDIMDSSVPGSSKENSQNIENKITDIILKATNKTQGFYALTNAKADFLISKQYGHYYTPSLIVSKNLFYQGGDATLVNKFRYNDFYGSFIPTYNFNNIMLFGVQAMYQTPNFEMFLGSDNIFKTATMANTVLKQDASIGSGYNGVSFYMGIGIKFGYTVEHPLNSSYMPGIDDNERSFFKRLFGIFSKKR